VSTIGGRAGSKPLPVGLIIVSEYKLGARWRPRQISAGKGALAVLAHTVSARRQPEAALHTLQQFISSAPVLKGVRGEVEQVVDFVVKTLGDR
jgi:hypothetical protein